MEKYVEYSTSAGHGTLVDHGVCEVWNSTFDGPKIVPIAHGSFDIERDFIMQSITPERYSEFISIHGGERAV